MINSDEIVIIGTWKMVNGSMVADESCQRIVNLVSKHLRLLGKDSSGWDTLYQDPNDGRLWELFYPESESHGGGAPQLRFLTDVEANNKYDAAALSRIQS